MILTEKAKQDFEKWLSNNYPELFNDFTAGYILFDTLNNTCNNAFIIEWFDSVGIEIFPISGWRYTTGERDGIDVEIVFENDRYIITDSKIRLEATGKAIEKSKYNL